MIKNNTDETIDPNRIKPVLIISERTITDYLFFLQHLLVGLADESVHVGVICPADCNVESLLPLPIEVIKYPTYDMPLLWLQNRKILLEKLARFGPTIFHCLCETKASFTRTLSRRMRLPYILSINSLSKNEGRIFVSNSRCAKIIVPAKTIAAACIKKNPRLSGLIQQVNIGTFVENEECCFNDDNEIANLITTYKGENPDVFYRFLSAIKKLAIDEYKFVLVIISENKAERQLRKMLNDPIFSEIIIVVPRLQPWHTMLTAGDIFIRACASDSFEPLLLEAMSVGNAIAGCKGGVDDLIIDGKTAEVFNPNDENDVYQTLKKLISNRHEAKKLAKSAMEFLRQKHSVSAMFSGILNIYKQVQMNDSH